MPTNRKIVFANGEYYHLFNRGVEKRLTFTNKYELIRALDVIYFYRFGDLPIRYSKYLALDKEKKNDFLKNLNNNQLQIEIIAFCLMRNHFHFLVRQLKNNGIVKFMAQFQNSYTKYFNTKHDRVGPLFQGVFKAVHVEDDEQLLHLSRYIHLNPVTGSIVKIAELENYQWSSYPNYLGITSTKIVNTSQILSFFKRWGDYKKFVLDQADYLGMLESLEHVVID